jgi:hypothetical protein
MKTNLSTGLPAVADLDLAAAAAITAHEELRQSERTARDERREAQRERLQLIQQAADKLREMAHLTFGSGLWQGLLGAGGAICGLSDGRWAQLGKRLVEASVHCDPLSISRGYREVDKQLLEARAEEAGNRAQQHGDAESEARRLQASAGALLQKVHEARRAAALAALKG